MRNNRFLNTGLLKISEVLGVENLYGLPVHVANVNPSFMSKLISMRNRCVLLSDKAVSKLAVFSTVVLSDPVS